MAPIFVFIFHLLHITQTSISLKLLQIQPLKQLRVISVYFLFHTQVNGVAYFIDCKFISDGLWEEKLGGPEEKTTHH